MADLVQHNPRPLGGALVIQSLPGIGDMVWHLRALKAISRESADGGITLLTRKNTQAEALFGHEKWIKEILWLDEQRHFGPLGGISLGLDLKPYRFESVWILHHSPRYYIAASFAGIPRRFGYGFGWLKDLLTAPFFLTRSYKSLHPIRKFEKLFQLLKIPLNPQDHALRALPEAEEAIGQRYLSSPKPWIALGFGATNHLRIWPTDKFVELGCTLAQTNKNTIFLCGAPNEQQRGEEIQQAIQRQGKDVVLATNNSLQETIALLGQCKYFVGNDSGLLNIAAALGVPSIGIFPALGPQLYSLDLFDLVLAYQRSRTTAGIEEISVTEVAQAVKQMNKI